MAGRPLSVGNILIVAFVTDQDTSLSRHPPPDAPVLEAQPADERRRTAGPGISVYAEMLLLSFIFGVSPVASKFAAEGFAVFTVAVLRVLIASVAFVPIIVAVQRGRPRLTGRDVGWFLVLGATGFLIFGSLYFLGLQLTTASHAVIVFGAGPMATALLSALILREALTGEKLGGIVLTVVGVALIVVSSGANIVAGSVAGDLAMLGAIVSWSFYSIFAKRLIERFGALLTTAYSVLAGTILLLPVALFTGMTPATLAAAPTAAWLGVLFSGLVSTVLAYILWNRGVSSIGPTLTSVFSNLAPVWGFIYAFLLRGEQITVWHLLSGILVVGGVTLANRSGLLQALGQRSGATA